MYNAIPDCCIVSVGVIGIIIGVVEDGDDDDVVGTELYDDDDKDCSEPVW